MSNKIGLYIRVSTAEQAKGILSQENALLDYCLNHNITDPPIYKDTASGGIIDRPQLKKLQEDIFLGKIQTVIVWKLDRLSRSLKDGIGLMVDWLEKGVRIVAVAQQFDFGGVVGKLIASVLLGIAEMERANIRENIVRGMQAARLRGAKIGGRTSRIQLQDIQRLHQEGYKVVDIAKQLQCSRQAVYLAMQRGRSIP